MITRRRETGQVIIYIKYGLTFLHLIIRRRWSVKRKLIK
uniref:Uncharacterized protein n=1 Tax=Klebsiella pneumoniae subsp. pneumoniae TaxID=72407 RepID=A0A8F7KSZ5_KLEPN|nr:hypothetical protein [Klebsiella pneumoniae subsp. pneumoniae]